MEKSIKYAGFFVRILAFIVDIAISVYIIDLVVGLNRFPVISLVILWLYFTIAITLWKTTIGGKLFNIEVRSEEGNNLSFLKASIRYVVSILPFVLYIYLRDMQFTLSPLPSPELQMLPQLILFLPPFVMLFTKKKQMLHDIAAKSVVVDLSKAGAGTVNGEHSKNASERMKKREAKSVLPKGVMHYGQMTLRSVGIVLSLFFGGYILIYGLVFYMIGKAKTEAYNRSFYTTYPTQDFNDSRILFYKKELERYSKEFIEAKGMYEIFAADVKKDLALNCIEAALKEHNVTNWIKMGSGFRKNARNKFANSEERIELAKRNEDWMGRHFYDYDLNDVNHIVDQIANIWEKDKNKQTCDALMPVEKMFDTLFMPKYIKNREEALARYKYELKTAKPGDYLDPSFYRNIVNIQTAWLNQLKSHNPNALKLLHEQKAKELRKREEAEKLRLQKALWECATKNSYFPLGFFEGVDANIRNEQGQTPLMVAAMKMHYNCIYYLDYAKVDVYLKDNEGRSAYDYIPSPANREEKMFADRTKAALRMLEAYQVVRREARIVHASYTNRTDIVTITIKNRKCSEFRFPSYIKCYDLNPDGKSFDSAK